MMLALACSISVSAAIESFRITDIRVEGLQRVSASPVFAALPIATGDFADTESLRIATQSLFDTGFFDDVVILRDGGVLIFKVKERPTISEIKIEGNKAIKTEALKDAMSKNELAEGQIFKRSTLDGIVNELQRQYVAQGRYSAEVKATTVDLPNNQVKIDIVVDEGEVAKIKHINIVGNQVFASDELLKLFELKDSDWFSWITSNDRYAREKLKGDLEKLESYYLDRGYLDFSVVSSQVSLSPDQKSVYITLNVNEGEKYTINKIDLAGDLILPEARIRQLILLQEGRTFSQILMTTTSETITKLLGNAGYTNAKVEGHPVPNKEKKTVDVTFLVDPSQRVYVRRIEFRGNTKTQDEVLRREMRQMEGGSASNDKIDQGKVRLERLGFFKKVEAKNKDIPGYSDLIDVEYTVEEQPSASINATVGYGQGVGLQFGASLQHNNWQGSGKQVGISANSSAYQKLVNLSYVDPYFTPDGVNRGISMFYVARDYGAIGVTSYDTSSYGLNFRFGYPLSEIQRLEFNFGYTHLAVDTSSTTVQDIRRTPFALDLTNNSEFYVTQTAVNNIPAQLNGALEDYSIEKGLITDSMLVQTPPGFIDLYGDSFDTLNMGFSWLRSTLNKGIMATRGSKQTLAFDLTVPGSELQYYTLQYNGQVFQPLSDIFTLRFRTSLGYGEGYGDMDRLPFFKNYYAGGFGSVRGYERSSLGPHASPYGQYTAIPTDFTAVDDNLNNVWESSDFDGINDGYIRSDPAYILCEADGGSVAPGTSYCVKDRLLVTYGYNNARRESFGGNVLIEFGADLFFRLPFIDDQSSFQTSLFFDAGNVFDTQCGSNQVNCTNTRLDELRTSVGIGLDWLSPMGPLTFSLANTLNDKEGDDTQAFQFSLAAPY
jgi:outer membrane protein insertion porin family